MNSLASTTPSPAFKYNHEDKVIGTLTKHSDIVTDSSIELATYIINKFPLPPDKRTYSETTYGILIG